MHLIGLFSQKLFGGSLAKFIYLVGEKQCSSRTFKDLLHAVTNVSSCGTLLRHRNSKLRRKHSSSISHLWSFPLSTQHTGAHVQLTIPLTNLLYKAKVRKRKKEGGKKQSPTLESVMHSRMISAL